jgi:peptidoglycan/xylan/chitin deacetylase (PgdA/CDA1 family)
MLKTALEWLGVRLARPIYGGRGCILSLHRVIPPEQHSSLACNHALELSPSELDDVLSLLKRCGYEFISMDAVPHRIREPRKGRFAAITLDDGYRDNVTHALPVFERHEAPFTVFATKGFSEHWLPVWWYTLAEALLALPQLEITLQGQRCSFALSDRQSREAAFQRIAAGIRASPQAEIERLLQEISTASGIDPLEFTRKEILTAAELQSLSQHPLATVGAHTVRHLTLNRLTDAALKEELGDSKTWLEAVLNKPVRHLAYPFGGKSAVGQREFEAARASGFETAVTTRHANLFPAHQHHLWSLPRLEISGNYHPARFTNRAASGMLPAIRNQGRRVVAD